MALKVYLAARFRDREILKRSVVPDLQDIGMEVTSRWINWLDLPENEHTYNQVQDEEIPEEDKIRARSQWSLVDLVDILKADFIIHFTQPPRGSDSRGGRHFESGFAYGLRKPIFVVGPREHNFYCLPEVSVWETWDQLYTYLSTQTKRGTIWDAISYRTPHAVFDRY